MDERYIDASLANGSGGMGGFMRSFEFCGSCARFGRRAGKNGSIEWVCAADAGLEGFLSLVR
jgi:hypothetical protein